MKVNKQPQTRYRVAAAVVISIMSLSLISCQQEREQRGPTTYAPLSSNSANKHGQMSNYSEPNLTKLAAKLNQGNQQVHIVQMGDSHTAADFFSGSLRDLFQLRYGNAGPGFVPPVSIPGQRTATINRVSENKKWVLFTSRKDERADYPLGGFIAQPLTTNSVIELKEFKPTEGRYQVQALYQATSDSQLIISPSSSNVVALPSTGPRWQFSKPVMAQLPTLATTSKNDAIKLGGWFIKSQQPGVILSALGINGATINMFDKWQNGWSDTLAQLSPDMIILSYGTNEAFNDKLDINAYKQSLQQKVRLIRRNMPDAVILLVGPNDSIKFKQNDSCSEAQPIHLTNVISAQKAVAQEEHTLFWDWREFMGGSCSVRSWAAQDLARPDLVHMSAAGYEKSAQALYSQLIQTIK
nr:SGNH/GDSL hydrolase family protein [uncultured Moellerella sp.]